MPDESDPRPDGDAYTEGYRAGYVKGYDEGTSDGRFQGYAEAKHRAFRALVDDVDATESLERVLGEQ
jgi:flagellar biosynthesis/type III secretory pathway protein FliH